MRTLSLLVLALLGWMTTSAIAGASEPIIELPKFVVSPEGLSVDYHVGPAGYIQSVVVKEVKQNTSISRAGTKAGDVCVSIDGVKVIGLSKSDFEKNNF
jgi:S1-C subfamily serine protease